MLHQDSVQTGWAYPPALYGAYEREYHESQFEHGEEKKWYEEPETGRAVVAPWDTRDRASCICESERNISVMMERQGKG